MSVDDFTGGVLPQRWEAEQGLDSGAVAGAACADTGASRSRWAPRMREEHVFDFERDEDEMRRITALDTGSSLFLDHRDPAVAGQLGTFRLPEVNG
jgi:hypothetical protein